MNNANLRNPVTDRLRAIVTAHPNVERVINSIKGEMEAAVAAIRPVDTLAIPLGPGAPGGFMGMPN